ncbi:MAG: restriction endonuclease subunit S [Caulobacter sp.]|nr:restriction endonuclease subunit S [Caulobacter sp.]
MNVHFDGVRLEGLAHLDDTQAAALANVEVAAGDVLLNITGASIGRVAVAPAILAGARVNQHVSIIRLAAGLEPQFVRAYLASPVAQAIIGGENYGVTRPALTKGLIEEMRIPVAPLAEQRRIVAKLDGLITSTARARAELDRVPALATRYKQSVLGRAFSGQLTAAWRAAQSAFEPISPRSEGDIRAKYRTAGASTGFTPPYGIPKSWRWLRLPELGDMDRGKSRHRPRDDPRLFGGLFPFVQTGEVRAADRYLTSYAKTYSPFGLEQSRLWPAGTVCITIAANIAETAILGIDACFPDSVVGFSADQARCLPEYVEYFIRTAKADLEQFAPATAQKNINLEVLGAIRLPVPPLGEQAEIVRKIDVAFAEIDRLSAETSAARKLLDRLDQAVLAKAFRGDLVPQDPADEPASVLLDLIRAERAGAPKGKRERRPREAA